MSADNETADPQAEASRTSLTRRLEGFVFERILLEEPEKCRLTLLGTFPASSFLQSHPDTPGTTDARKSVLPAIIRIEKTAISLEVSQNIFSGKLGGLLSQVKCVENTDIVG
ncbi:hypothetical protein B0H10DRAFT_2018465 [Mycena sp. CBHHK59/15]|nr:hypothetical protein B0H10DRAFT_2018465 [Mycena sp. CBHHK59/15]